MDPLTVIATSWTVFKLGYDVIKFINTEFPEKDLDYYRVFVSNEYSKPIYFVLHYLFNKTWKTSIWELSGGETSLLLGSETKMKNRFIYYYACDKDFSWECRGNEYFEVINGRERGFKKTNIGAEFCNFTLQLGSK